MMDQMAEWGLQIPLRHLSSGARQKILGVSPRMEIHWTRRCVPVLVTEPTPMELCPRLERDK